MKFVPPSAFVLIKSPPWSALAMSRSRYLKYRYLAVDFQASLKVALIDGTVT